VLKKKRIICLYGGPGTGKSTTCAGLFYRLKSEGYSCEMNREYIKDWVWEGRKINPGDQMYIFSKMARKEHIYIQNEMDFIITDSPLVLTHFYGVRYCKYERDFNTSLAMLVQHHAICKDNGYKVDHIFLNRCKSYVPKGRLQKEEVARTFDRGIKDMLNSLNITYTEIDADDSVIDNIFQRMSRV
jgi:nicotinamide riboside kinase